MSDNVPNDTVEYWRSRATTAELKVLTFHEEIVLLRREVLEEVIQLIDRHARSDHDSWLCRRLRDMQGPGEARAAIEGEGRDSKCQVPVGENSKALIERWRRAKNLSNDPARAMTYGYCADELEGVVTGLMGLVKLMRESTHPDAVVREQLTAAANLMEEIVGGRAERVLEAAPREMARRWLIGKDCRYKSDTFLAGDVDDLEALLNEAEAVGLERAACVIDAEVLAREKFENHMTPIDELAQEIRALKE